MATVIETVVQRGGAFARWFRAIEDRTRGAEVGCYSCMLNAARGELNLASAFGRWCLATSMVAAGDTDRAGTLMALLNAAGGEIPLTSSFGRRAARVSMALRPIEIGF